MSSAGYNEEYGNPVILGEPTALRVLDEPEIATQAVTDLNRYAKASGFIKADYRVVTRRGMAIPEDYAELERMSVHSYFSSVFLGKFAGYCKIELGVSAGSHSMDAMCLMFEDATILPYENKVPENHRLYVPILSVVDIREAEAIL